MTGDGRGRHRKPAPSWIALAGAVPALAVTAVAVGALFLGPTSDRRPDLPVGFDTTKYLFRANAVIADGVGSLDDITPPSLHLGTNPERPGHPVIVALVSGVTGLDPLHLAVLTPAIMAITVALAAGAFALLALREEWWAFPVFGIATGGSLLVARTAVGSIDNLMFDAVGLAMLGCAIAFADRDRGMMGAVVLAAGATLIHWNLAALSIALLLGLAVVAAIPSLLLRRRGTPWWHTPLPRLLAAAGAGAIAGAVSLVAAAAVPSRIPHVPMAKIRNKSEERLPSLRLPFFGVTSTLGAVSAWFAADTRRRLGAALLVLWAAALPLSALLFAAGYRVPVYRVATFALALPMLAAMLVTAPGRLVARRRPVVGAVVGIVLGAAALWATLPWSSELWRAQEPISRERFEQALAAGAYLRSVSTGRPGPAVYVVATRKITLADHLIRGGAPPEAVDDVFLFPGTMDDLRRIRRGDDAPLTDPSVDRRRLTARAIVAELLDDRPIVLFLTAFNAFQRPPPDAIESGPGVFVVEGPPPGEVAPPALPQARPSSVILVGLLLLATGSGWSVASVHGSFLVRAGLAMAFGLAVLAVVGTGASRLGMSLDRTAAWWLVGVSVLAGWLVAAAAAVIRGRMLERGAGTRDEPPAQERPDAEA